MKFLPNSASVEIGSRAPSVRGTRFWQWGEVVIEPGRVGSFEILRDGEAVYSKLETGSFWADDEVKETSAG